MQRYTAAIDVWSAGCIMAELLTMLPESGYKPHERSALFPGSSCFPLSPSGEDLQLSAPYDQLSTIVRVIGTSQGDLSWIENEELREYLRAMPPVERTPLAGMYPGASEEAVDLLERMLAFNPAERCTVQQVRAPRARPAARPLCLLARLPPPSRTARIAALAKRAGRTPTRPCAGAGPPLLPRDAGARERRQAVCPAHGRL